MAGVEPHKVHTTRHELRFRRQPQRPAGHDDLVPVHPVCHLGAPGVRAALGDAPLLVPLPAYRWTPSIAVVGVLVVHGVVGARIATLLWGRDSWGVFELGQA
jgi:hypothetical protein